MKDREMLDLLINLGGIISEMFGDKCEVAISQDKVIVAIFNGHISNRKVGDHIGPEADIRVESIGEGCFVNYSKTNKTNPEYDLKSSTMRFELDGKLTTFCINYDNSMMFGVYDALTDFLTINGLKPEQYRDKNPIEAEFFEALATIDKPVHTLTKLERMRIIEILHEKGSLNYSKSIVTIARLMGVTRYTIYNYLKELNLQ